MKTITKGFGAVALMFALSGCSGILDVKLPGSTPADALDDPSYAPLLVTSAQGMFENALATLTFGAGNLAGEIVGGQSALADFPFQARNISHGDTQGDTQYNQLSAARFQADDALKRMNAWTDAQVANRTKLIGQAALVAGYSYAYFADNYCRGAFDAGPAVNTQGMLALAKDRFTTAITSATTAGDATTLNTAYVGRARVELELGQTAEALADAQKVPAGFTASVTRSSASTDRRNPIFNRNVTAKSMSIDPHYWPDSVGAKIGGVNDPRVKVTNAKAITADGVTPLYTQGKYTSDGSPIRYASYTEAQLIIAEVSGGQTAIDIINKLHAANGLPAFAGGTAQQIKDQIVAERRDEFFLEARRLGDLNRYGGFDQWAFGKNPFLGYQYGAVTCFPLPDAEVTNNPNLSQTS